MHNHRIAFLQFLHVLVGSNVQLQTNDGNVFEGIFHTATPFKNQKYQYAMKNTQVVMDKTNCNVKKGTTLLVPYDSILSVSVVDLDLSTKGSNADLQIDDVVRNKSISHLEGRDLEAVSSSWVSSHVNASLEGDNSKTEWNQFETNARLFNVKSTYDENLYTKKLDMSTVTKDKLAEAERLAREIESSTTSDIHLQEERGQVLQREIDEETLYSGVVRENSVSPNTNKKVLSAANSDVWKRAAKPSPTTTNAQTSSSSSPNKPKESVWNKMKPETKAVSETTDVLVKTVLDNASTPMPLIQQKEDVTPKVPETSNSSDDNHESSNQISPPIKSTLKATATEWKPNVDAKEFVPPGDLDNSGPSFDNPLDMMPQIPMQVMPGYPFQQFQQMMPTQMMAPIDVSMYGYDQAMMMPPGPFMQQGGFIHMAPPMGMGVPDAAMMGYPGYPGAYGNAFGGPMHMLPQHSPYVGRGQGNMGPSDGRNGR